MSDLKIDGFKELDEALGRLPEAFRRNVVLAGLRKASDPIVQEARRLAPRGSDPKRRGGKKQRATGKSVSMGSAADSVRARAEPATTQHEATVSVGPDAAHFYWRFFEFGTSRRGVQVLVGYRPSKSRKSKYRTEVRKVYQTVAGGSRQAALRPLTRAFDVKKQEALELLGVEVWKSLQATVARLARRSAAGTLSDREVVALRNS